MKYTRTILQNGLRVLTIPMPSFESVTVLAMVGAGSRYETKKNSGISHFLEHMAFKGTSKRPSAMAISTLIDGIGGEFNAFTGKETTGYYIKSSANNIELSVDVISDMLQNSLLDPAEINKERGVILEEINLYEDTPARKIGDVFESLLYGDTPLGWDIAGDKAIIKAITQDDFKNYMASLYSSDNITVVVAGGVTPKKSEALVEKYFGSMKSFKTLTYSPVVIPSEVEGSSSGKIATVASLPRNDTRVLIKHKKTEQVHIALGVRTVPINHNDRFPLSVLASILGGGMSSRLFHEVREKRGLGYYVRTFSEEYQDCGSLVSTAGIDPKRVEEAITVIVDEYHRISNIEYRILNEELKKAKEYMKGHMILEMEDSRSVAGFYASQELLEKSIDNLEDDLIKIDKVTKEEVAYVANTYLKPERLNLAVIGDFEDGEKFQRLLE